MSELALLEPKAAEVPQPPPKAQKAERTPPRYEQLETGIYRYKAADGSVTYHERPTIDGTRTYRSLGVNFAPQSSLKNARDEFHRRRSEIAAGRNPYAPTVPEGKSKPEGDTEPKKKKEQFKTMGQVIALYRKDGCPDKWKQKRTGDNLHDELSNCDRLMEFWENILVEDSGPAECDNFHTWYTEHGCRNGAKGNRMADRLLSTLNTACRWCCRSGYIKYNPIADRPKYQPSSEVKHCREFQPQSGDELHASASYLFNHPRSVVLGFQLLEEACTGLRTEEILKWGTDIFGTTTDDGENVHVWREKNQHHNNPYVENNEGLKAVLKAHKAWLAANYPEGTETLYPSYDGGSISKGALGRALRRLFKSGKFKRKLRSHGMRAFFVLVHRSWGVADEEIAFKLGHSSNGACIRTTYGGVPDNWRNGGGPKMSWLPTKAPLAWAQLEANGWTANFPPSTIKGKKRDPKTRKVLAE